MGLFGRHAKDIDYTTQEELFEAIGYLAKQGRINYIEAQVPKDKENYLNENYLVKTIILLNKGKHKMVIKKVWNSIKNIPKL